MIIVPFCHHILIGMVFRIFIFTRNLDPQMHPPMADKGSPLDVECRQESPTADNSRQHIWRISHSMHFKDLFGLFEKDPIVAATQNWNIDPYPILYTFLHGSQKSLLGLSHSSLISVSFLRYWRAYSRPEYSWNTAW